MGLNFRINDTTHIYNAVVNSCKNAGLKILMGEKLSGWNILWSGPIKGDFLRDFTKYQKVNHFPDSCQIGRKDYMWKNIKRLKRVHGNEFDFCPETYLLPDDYKKWMQDRENEGWTSYWIMKPNAASCGRGIKILAPKQAPQKKNGYLACKYVSNPHLIDGFKYDLRVYVLVSSFDPLKVYVYDEGLARFATEKYT